MASYIADFFLIPQGTYIHVPKWPAYLAVPHTGVLHGQQLWDYAKVLQYVTLPSHMTQRGNSHILIPHPSSLYQNVSAVALGNQCLQGSRKKKTHLGPAWDTLGVSNESMGRKPKYLAGWLGTMINEWMQLWTKGS